MKKQTIAMLLGGLALTLTGCDLIWEALRGSFSSEETGSLASIPMQDGLMVREGEPTEYGGYAYAPASPASDAYELKTSAHKLEDIKDSTLETPFPTSGTQRILVIPVKIKGYESVATEKNRQNIYQTFFGDPADTGWESVASFYYKSSFQQLTITGVVSEWYNCGYSASQIPNLTKPNAPSSYDPTWTILEKAWDWYKTTYHTEGTEFDNNNDGFVDGVWLVYGAPNYMNNRTLDSDIFWAYTYFDNSVLDGIQYVSDLDRYKGHPVPYHYCWASYDHMFEGYGSHKVDAHTYIHETGHLMGLPDYYVAAESDNYTTNYAPMGWVDMMDANVIDHNAYSKLAYGWIKPYVLSKAGTVKLRPSASTGECLIIPTSRGWNGTVFDEYILLEYYTPTDLNASDSEHAYANGVRGFTKAGVRAYHVDSRLFMLDPSTWTPKAYVTSFNANRDSVDFANSNSAGYNYVAPTLGLGNLEHRLIQIIDCVGKKNFDTDYQVTSGVKKSSYVAGNDTLFTQGKTLSFDAYANTFPNYKFHNKSTMNNGGSFPYEVRVNSLTDSEVELVITKIS